MRTLRAERDITQADLAQRLGVTRQTIIAVEKGKYSPTLQLAFEIAAALDVPLEDVFEYD
ncbi:MAG: helix-turn-helix transcriptional regulator [Acidimicrobiia bacterium]